MSERLQKVLAAAGVASRRDAEKLISEGKVTVNGQTVTDLGRLVDAESDHITVSGKALARNVEKIYVALHKPKGCMTTRDDPHATSTVMDLVVPPLEARLGRNNPSVAGLHPVGRLDVQTEGLLLLTNDGEFTHTLTHPSHQVPKFYTAYVRGIPDQAALERLRTGIPLFGRRTLPARVRIDRADRNRNTAKIEIELREGRQQQVRRMMQIVGCPVDRLVRTAIGRVTLGRLKPGQWRFLTPAEVAGLLENEPALETGPPRRRPASGERNRRPQQRPAAQERRTPGPRSPRGPSSAVRGSHAGTPTRTERTDRADRAGRSEETRTPRAPRTPSTKPPRRTDDRRSRG